MRSSNSSQRTYFSPNVEAIARDWFENPVETRPWDITDTTYTNNSTCPSVAKQGSIQGFIKPKLKASLENDTDQPLSDLFTPCAKEQAYVSKMPIAAFEKMASDFGYLLKLPIAPVRLYWNKDAPVLAEKKACISLKCSEQVISSRKQAMQSITTDQYAEYIRQVSRMEIFKAWIGDFDRRTDNVVFLPDTIKPYFFDHSNLPAFANGQIDKRYIINPDPEHNMVPISMEDCKATLTDIQNLSEDTINLIVHRIPEEFLSTLQKSMLVEYLTTRQAIMKQIVQIHDDTPRYQNAHIAAQALLQMRDKVAGHDCKAA